MSNQSQSRLLALPAELRNRIYAFVVVEDEAIPAYVAQRTANRDRKVDAARSKVIATPREAKRTVLEYKLCPEQPSMAYVSRTVREQVLPMFYGLNVFVFNLTSSSDHHLTDWRRIAHRRGVELPRRMILEFDMRLLPSTATGGGKIRSEEHGEAEFWLSEEGSVDMRFGGAMQQECCCKTREALIHNLGPPRRYPRGGLEDVWEVAIGFERKIWHLSRSVTEGEETICVHCGQKVRPIGDFI